MRSRWLCAVCVCVQVDERLLELSTAFLAAFDQVQSTSCGLRHIRPLPLSLSTITFTGKISMDRVDLETVALGMEIGAADEDPFVLGINGDLANDEEHHHRKRPRRQRKKFHNQLPLVARSGKAVKLFHNGSIHVTGCASPVEFLNIVDQLCAYLPTVCAMTGRPRLETFDTQMINANFLLCAPDGGHVKLRPKRLRAELSRNPQSQADFETERHPGVKVTVCDETTGTKIATVMVFQTGSVQISGAKHPAHVAAAYTHACTRLDAIVDELGEDIMVPAPREPRTTTAKQTFGLVNGYPSTLFNPCLC